MLSRIIYATGSASATPAAQLTVQNPTKLVGVLWAVDFDSITDNALVILELTRINAQQTTVLDARESIMTMRWRGNFVTSGLAQAAMCQFIPAAVQFKPQDIIYLHATVSGTVTYIATLTTWWA